MSLTTSPDDLTGEPAPRKPRWRRCQKRVSDGVCGERVYNDPDDLRAHFRRHEREDNLAARVGTLAREIDTLAGRLNRAPAPVSDDSIEPLYEADDSLVDGDIEDDPDAEPETPSRDEYVIPRSPFAQ